MENLTVVHKKGRIQRVKGFPLDWETCVRHIAFYEHDGDQVRVEDGCQVYQGAEAYYLSWRLFVAFTLLWSERLKFLVSSKIL